MVDNDGFRLNVGIILSNPTGHLFWGRRTAPLNAWQFPQGGMQPQETPQEAMYRELYEEIGLEPTHVQVLGETQGWLSYQLPKHLQRPQRKPLCIGQKQRWFLLRLLSGESCICLNRTKTPEFNSWRWIDYWQPVDEVVAFKKNVYQHALEELAPLLHV